MVGIESMKLIGNIWVHFPIEFLLGQFNRARVINIHERLENSGRGAFLMRTVYNIIYYNPRACISRAAQRFRPYRE